MLPMAYTVVGESRAHAEEREQVFLNDLVDPMASLTLLSELMNYDFSGLEPRRADHRRAHRVGHGHPRASCRTCASTSAATPSRSPTWPATGPRCCRARASSAPVARSPTRWRSGSTTDACDGFVIAATHSPAPTRTSCAWSSPSCSGGACSATATPGSTLREHLGPGPARSGAAWLTGAARSHGLRVIEAATLAAGPMVGTALGEFGAEVIKVEQPGTGDPMRTWGNRKDGIGLVWKSVSRNKRCVTLDLRQPEGQELFHELLDVSDVLIVGNRPSALARWGIDYESVHARHPHVVMLHITGYGGGGPNSDRPGYGTLAEAMSGFAHVVGQPDGPPTLPPFMLADGVASLAATYAVMMALYHRDVHGGEGQLVDVNLIEPLARLIETSPLGLRPARDHPGPRRQPARRQRAPQRLPHRRRPVARHLQRVAEHRHAGLPGHRPARPGRGPRLRRPGPARRRGPSRSTSSSPTGSASARSTRP